MAEIINIAAAKKLKVVESRAAEIRKARGPRREAFKVKSWEHIKKELMTMHTILNEYGLISADDLYEIERVYQLAFYK